MVAKKRRIAKKPVEQTPDGWVKAGGVDPELSDIQTSKSLNVQVSERLDIQTSESLDVQTPNTEKTAKSKRADYTRATIYIPKTLHKRMKMAQLTEDIEMSEIAEKAISAWLDDQNI